MKLDDFLPAWQFNEVHAVTVDATPERVFISIKQFFIKNPASKIGDLY